MKTTFRNLLFFLGLTFPFQACHQDPIPEIPRIQAAELEFIGVEHNEKLQDAFQFLVANRNSMGHKSPIANKQVLENFLIAQIEGNTQYPANMNEPIPSNFLHALTSNLLGRRSILKALNLEKK
jgi:hypothetical protein